MKTNFNHIGRALMAFIATIFSLVFFLLPAAAASAKSAAAPVVVMLQPGVTGTEIQQALDALPASGGAVVLPPGEIAIRQPVILRPAAGRLRQLSRNHHG
jgi:hypothetical protein